MRWSVDAIFEDGVLKPVGPVPLHERDRVRITVESEDGSTVSDDDGAMKRLVAALRASPLRYGGALPSRDELHER